jgi:hypothetical protein
LFQLSAIQRIVSCRALKFKSRANGSDPMCG